MQPSTPNNPANHRAGPIVRFYHNQMPDHAGRYLREILARDDAWLEHTHDYIQWLFPMRAPSPVNPAAPTVDDATIAAFAADDSLRDSLAAAFARMMRFYGFDLITSADGLRLQPAHDWPARSSNWLTPRNHNMLRITRILTSLRLLGLPSHTNAFFAALQSLKSSPEGSPITPTTFAFWTTAATTRA